MSTINSYEDPSGLHHPAPRLNGVSRAAAAAAAASAALGGKAGSPVPGAPSIAPTATSPAGAHHHHRGQDAAERQRSTILQQLASFGDILREERRRHDEDRANVIAQMSLQLEELRMQVAAASKPQPST